MTLPNITQAQILAVIGWAVSQLVAYGVLDTSTSQVVLSSAATFVAAAWTIGDAWIRHARNQVRAAAVANGQPDPAARK